ncbi:MAG: class I SAM-dependent methyltransferase [Spirochaetia bacterium]|nr:class I SAM-dependent methyltransferase [Spirochaetia bacterium]
MNRAHKIFDFVKQRHLASDDQKTMLDIGCNKGFLLKVAIEENFNVFGVELVPEVIRPFCNTYPKFKDQIFSEKFQTVSNRFEDKYFDIITAIDVVEHFEDPLSDLKSIRRLLKDDGVFIVQTPNIECENSKKLGCNWKALKPLEHMHLFSENNFITFGKMAGFSKITTYKPFEEAAGNFVAVLYP